MLHDMRKNGTKGYSGMPQTIIGSSFRGSCAYVSLINTGQLDVLTLDLLHAHR